MKALLLGGGRPLWFLAQTLARKGHAVTVVSRDAHECAHFANRVAATIVHGDATDPGLLEDAGARSAQLVLAAMTNDADNLVACQVAQRWFAVPRVIALVNDPDNQEVFTALGVQAISTVVTVASLVEQRVTIDQVTNLIPAADGRVTLTEITLEEQNTAVGRRVVELGLPRDALIAVITRAEQTIVPRGETQLQVGDRVLLVALPESHPAALRLLTTNGG
ncbi:MAG: TrkA family potassium uptake protein [Planctomycetes bacterium]|nr:TrkA family potassium uptake protein [Planctomycetota bacterium]